jgi:hypothetical protein
LPHTHLSFDTLISRRGQRFRARIVESARARGARARRNFHIRSITHQFVPHMRENGDFIA